MSMSKMIRIKHEVAANNPEAAFSSVRMREIFSRLKMLGTGKKDRKANEFLGKEIKSLREELKNNIISVFQLSIKNKNYLFEYWLEDYAKVFSTIRKDTPVKVHLSTRYEPYKEAWKQYKTVLASERKKAREHKPDLKETLGFTYSMTGGVFTKDKSVVALQTVENQMNRIKKPKKPSSSQSSNYIGIELELVAKVNRERLNKLLCENFLAGYVYVKDDSSIQREQNDDHAHEVTVLCREVDVKDIVTRLCKVLNSKEVESYVNDSCGLHVHIDARNRKVEHMFNNLVRCLPMLKGMIPKNRVESSHADRFCKLNKTHIFKEAQDRGDRYQAINADAFRNHKTIEVRMHSGTTNAAKIVNWVNILCTAVNHNELVAQDVTTPYQFQELFKVEGKLINYIVMRTDLFTGKLANAITTRSDHFFSQYNQVDLAI